MRDRLPTLHDPHNGGLRLEVTISSDSFVGLLIFGFGFFGLDLIYLDTVFGMGEAEVHVEGIADVDVFALWCFAKDTVASAGERLQGSLEFSVV